MKTESICLSAFVLWWQFKELSTAMPGRCSSCPKAPWSWWTRESSGVLWAGWAGHSLSQPTQFNWKCKGRLHLTAKGSEGNKMWAPRPSVLRGWGCRKASNVSSPTGSHRCVPLWGQHSLAVWWWHGRWGCFIPCRVFEDGLSRACCCCVLILSFSRVPPLSPSFFWQKHAEHPPYQRECNFPFLSN